MDGKCLSPYTCKCCGVFKQFDRLNFDGLAGKHQKHQDFVLYGIRLPCNVSNIDIILKPIQWIMRKLTVSRNKVLLDTWSLWL